MGSYQPGQSAGPAVTGTVPSQPSSNAPPATSKAGSKAGQHGMHVVAPGDTLYRISRQYSVPVAELARYNNIPPHTKLNIGAQIKVPGNRAPRIAQPETPKVAQAKSLNAAPKAKAEPKALPKSQPQASAPATESVAFASPAADASEPAATNAVRKANAGMHFRWPAKGRIIAGFGPKTNGQTNDGINIAVPEGTPVKAAADGTVAYAGNELKGYGNLVLVRHADGYVTAYAHAKELLVRRGDTVRRGQDIAKAGQTGNVDTPQLHFEIRKGPAPIDPMPLLNGGGG